MGPPIVEVISSVTVQDALNYEDDISIDFDYALDDFKYVVIKIFTIVIF